MAHIDLIAFDADDTLWHNETLYVQATDSFKKLLSDFRSPERIERQLGETELRNIPDYGYGIKSFTLSMIETAIELSGGQVGGDAILEILDISRQMLNADVRLIEHVEETLAKLSSMYALMLITKGEVSEQERKVERSGLSRFFRYVEILSEKSAESYRRLLAKYGVDPGRFLMIGNSLRSDIVPVVGIGGRAVYVPHPDTWIHETVVDRAIGKEEYFELEHLGQLPDLVGHL